MFLSNELGQLIAILVYPSRPLPLESMHDYGFPANGIQILEFTTKPQNDETRYRTSMLKIFTINGVFQYIVNMTSGPPQRSRGLYEYFKTDAEFQSVNENDNRRSYIFKSVLN